MSLYYVSWSPKQGEATYTRCFTTAAERDQFAASIACIAARTPHTWDNLPRKEARPNE